MAKTQEVLRLQTLQINENSRGTFTLAGGEGTYKREGVTLQTDYSFKPDQQVGDLNSAQCCAEVDFWLENEKLRHYGPVKHMRDGRKSLPFRFWSLVFYPTDGVHKDYILVIYGRYDTEELQEGSNASNCKVVAWSKTYNANTFDFSKFLKA
jgi:hypothetical protein